MTDQSEYRFAAAFGMRRVSWAVARLGSALR